MSGMAGQATGAARRLRQRADRQRATPEKITATRLAGRRPRRRATSRPARPAVPVALTAMPVAAAELVRRRTIASSGTTTGGRRSAAITSNDAEPVVGLVVEDAVGDRVRLAPTASSARPSAPGPASAPAGVRGPPPGPGQRRAPCGLHGVEADAGAEPPARRTRRTLRRRPARRRGRAPAPRRRPTISQPIVRPPSRHSAFSGPCTLNGTAPAATASRNRSTAGSPGGSSARRAHTVIVGAERLEQVEHDRPAPTSGTNTSIGQSARRGQRGRGDRRVAARGDGQRRRDRPSPVRSASAARRCSRIVDEVAGLVAAADVAGLVLDPHVAGATAAQIEVASARTA